jgi:hypothetical protein
MPSSTNRLRDHDSRGRLKLGSKADLKARGGEFPARADAVIGAAMRAHAPGRLTPADVELMQQTIRRLDFDNARCKRSGFVRF